MREERAEASSTGRRVELSDGRRLDYEDHGTPEGKPVFFFHGTPSSRRDWYLFGSEELTERLGVRVIAPDRPGIGLSDFQPGRRFGDWPADVIALADALAIDRFAVLGHSGGGPYAAVCARHIPERLTKVGLVSSTGPHDEPGLTAGINPDVLRLRRLARDKPRLCGLVYVLMGATVRLAPGRFTTQAMASLPKPDRAILACPEVQRAFLETVREALRNGPRGARLDTALMGSPWDFSPRDIGVEVHLWHGEADRNASPAMGRYLADVIPDSQPKFYPDEGHLSLIFKHAEEILGVLAS